MKRLLLRATFLSLLLAPAVWAAAQSPTITIASGPLGSTYRDVYGPNLGKKLHGYKVIQQATAGSGVNLELLANGKVDLVFAQADVYAGRLKRAPERYGGLLVLGKVAEECVYVARRKTSDISNLAQLGDREGKPATVAIGPAGGGASGTWEHLAQIVPGLAAVETRNEGGTLSLNQLAIGAFDAVVWVTDPANRDHQMFRAVELSSALTLMPISESGLIQALPDGVEVYRARQIVLGDKRNPQPLHTVCTSALVFARKDADQKLIQKAADAIALHVDEIAPKSKR